MLRAPIHLIAAVAENNVIGHGADIPWRAKGEQQLFKRITMGQSLVMGRRTFDAIGRALPGRDTIVVTRKPSFEAPDCLVARSVEEALDVAQSTRGECFVAGGGEIYAATIRLAQTLHLTTIHIEPEGDVFFPAVDLSRYRLAEETRYETNVAYTYRRYEHIG